MQICIVFKGSLVLISFSFIMFNAFICYEIIILIPLSFQSMMQVLYMFLAQFMFEKGLELNRTSLEAKEVKIEHFKRVTSRHHGHGS